MDLFLDCFRLNAIMTFEKEITFWIANVQQLIRPIATVNAFVVSQTGVTLLLMRLTERTFQIWGRAFRTVRIDTECILTARRRNWRSWNKMNFGERSIDFFRFHFTHDLTSVCHIQRPSCSYNGYVHCLYRRRVNHSRMFPKSAFHLCTKRIGHSYPDVHTPALRLALGNVVLLHCALNVKSIRKQRKNVSIKINKFKLKRSNCWNFWLVFTFHKRLQKINDFFPSSAQRSIRSVATNEIECTLRLYNVIEFLLNFLFLSILFNHHNIAGHSTNSMRSIDIYNFTHINNPGHLTSLLVSLLGFDAFTNSTACEACFFPISAFLRFAQNET